MRAIVFNDTSRFHHGCAAVMRTLLCELDAASIEVTESVYGNTWRFNPHADLPEPKVWRTTELVVINGEGTMHDDSLMASFLLDDVAARRGGRKLALVNSLWNRMSPRFATIAAGAEFVTVREPLSHAELGLASAVTMPNISFYERPAYRRLESQGLLVRTFFGSGFKDIRLDGAVDVTREDRAQPSPSSATPVPCSPASTTR